MVLFFFLSIFLTNVVNKQTLHFDQNMGDTVELAGMKGINTIQRCDDI